MQKVEVILDRLGREALGALGLQVAGDVVGLDAIDRTVAEVGL